MDSEETREKDELSRRTFVGTLALAGAALAACSQPPPPTKNWARGTRMTPGPQTAPDGEPLKAGLIGCGGRGTGAAMDFLAAGPNLTISALADLFQDRLDECREKIKTEAGVEVPVENCFAGFDAYQKLIDSGVDIVIQATPPHFRPDHFEAAITARKHVFMEKPVAVDPAGVRSVIATSERADALELTVVTGTQFRHQKSFIETYNRVVDGMIGDIVAARSYSLRGQLWYREPEPAWSEMEAMLRDWVNWNWLSGDHIVEQHIHGIDVINWFTNARPVKALGVGGRARRVTGDQYDFFAIDYELESGIHYSTQCRQIDGCTNNISRWVIGTKGYTNCENAIYDLDGKVLWEYPQTEDTSPYIQEHIDMVTAIRTGNRVNEAAQTAVTTMKAIMGRETAYTGKEVTYEEMMQSEMRLGPTEYAMEPVGMQAVVPVPGT